MLRRFSGWWIFRAVGAGKTMGVWGRTSKETFFKCMDLAVDVYILNLQHRPWLLSSPDNCFSTDGGILALMSVQLPLAMTLP